MFTKSAAFYDAIYASKGKNYEEETQLLLELIQKHKRSTGTTLLDIACGTGRHISHLPRNYQVEGLDKNPKMLEIARRRHPDVVFHQADMVDFDLDHRFDVVVCLFSSIGYVKTKSRLRKALRTMSRHLNPGGLVIIEPWLTPETYHEGTVNADFVDQPDLKIARMNVSGVEDDVSVLDFHYLVATQQGVEYFTERHELGLFSHEEYLKALRASGLDVVHDPEGLTNRGLYIGMKPFT